MQALRSSSFKKSLIGFLAKVWSVGFSSKILRDKVLFLNNDDTCWRYETVNGCILTEEVNHLSCSHEEADTRISIICPAFKVAITLFYEQMAQTVSLLDYQQWKNWLKMSMYGLE